MRRVSACEASAIALSTPLLQLAKNKVKEDYVLVIDADMIMRTPFTAEVSRRAVRVEASACSRGLGRGAGEAPWRHVAEARPLCAPLNPPSGCGSEAGPGLRRVLWVRQATGRGLLGGLRAAQSLLGPPGRCAMPLRPSQHCFRLQPQRPISTAPPCC